MKNEITFYRFLAAITISFGLLGCTTSDDSSDDDGIVERTKIRMPISNQNQDYNWNTARLVWSQDFDESIFPEDNWVFEDNSHNPDVADQLQVYKQENVEVSNGTLKIIAKKTGPGQNKGDYTSSRISGKYAFKYGRIEVSAKLPDGEKEGIWAKLGLLGDNENIVGWPKSGEIDIMEYVSFQPNQTYITVHSAENNADNGNLILKTTELQTAEEEFHAYGILWTDKYIKFYIDNPSNIIYTLDRPSEATEENWPFDQPFYLLADLVVGGRYAGVEGVDDTLFPAVFEIKYIRVYHAD